MKPSNASIDFVYDRLPDGLTVALESGSLESMPPDVYNQQIENIPRRIMIVPVEESVIAR